MTYSPTTLRGSDLQTLAGVLERQHSSKVDAVVPATSLTIEDCGLTVPNLDLVPDPEHGIREVEGHLDISNGALGDMAARYRIPVEYLRRCKTDACDLFAANVNEWMGRDLDAHDAPNKVLLRTFVDPDDGSGYLRSFLSDRFMTIDHLDVLYSALEGAKAASTDIVVDSVDLSERAMRVRLVAPQLTVLAPEFLKAYRRPWQPGQAPWERRGEATPDWLRMVHADDPVLFAGIEIGNSETGDGAFYVMPRMVVRWCRNGATVKADMLRRTHLGQKLDEGVIRWSDATIRANTDLVRRMATDAVSTFLDVDYMRKVIDGWEQQSGVVLPKPEETIKRVAQKLRYTDDERQSILSLFVAGGQNTAGGVMQAVTAHAQEIDDPDRAAEIEGSAADALALAAVGR